MGLLKLANTGTKKIYSEDGEDWIEVRETMSKRELNFIQTHLPPGLIDLQNEETRNDAKAAAILVIHTSPEFAAILFEALVVGWSLPVPATINNYLSLESKAASWIDNELMSHYVGSQTTKDELGKPTTSPKGSRKGTPVTV
jgi:hypothetical protein